MSSLLNARAGLDRRIETAVWGLNVVSLPRRLAAIRHVRAGNFLKVKLLHLIDRDDSGTTAFPLKSFGRRHCVRNCGLSRR